MFSFKQFAILALLSVLVLSCNKKDPVACFVVDSNLEKGAQYKLKNCSEQASNYTWDFGNSETSEEENPTISYSEDGKYVISLSVENKGKTDELVRTVRVGTTDLTVGSDGNYTGNYNEAYSDSASLDKSYPGTAIIEIINTKRIRVQTTRGSFQADVTGDELTGFAFSSVDNLNSRIINMTSASGSFTKSSKTFQFTLQGTDPQFGDIAWTYSYSGKL
ncbi:MAG: PKD domain-containing protein [Salibacteraceae bacterium]